MRGRGQHPRGDRPEAFVTPPGRGGSGARWWLPAATRGCISSQKPPCPPARPSREVRLRVLPREVLRNRQALCKPHERVKHEPKWLDLPPLRKDSRLVLVLPPISRQAGPNFCPGRLSFLTRVDYRGTGIAHRWDGQPPHAHRSGAGVIRAPVHAKPQPRGGGNPCDHADRNPLPIQHRPLLDVQLQVVGDGPARPACLVQACAVPAQELNGLGQRPPPGRAAPWRAPW